MSGLLVLLLAGAGAGGAFWYFYLQTDSDGDITAAKADLRQIWRGIREFQSEGYFAQAPNSLENLFHFRFKSYIPKPSPVEDQPSPGYSQIQREYMLIPDLLTFCSPTRRGLPDKGSFVCDYTLLSWYEMFLPDETVIAWDNPGNFRGGGNILYYDGRVEYCKMTQPEYKRFVKGLQTKSDREFIRSKCRDASVANFRKDPAD